MLVFGSAASLFKDEPALVQNRRLRTTQLVQENVRLGKQLGKCNYIRIHLLRR